MKTFYKTISNEIQKFLSKALAGHTQLAREVILEKNIIV